MQLRTPQYASCKDNSMMQMSADTFLTLSFTYAYCSKHKMEMR